MAARMSVDERRSLLVEAAIRVMAREGVAQTTTRSIVAEADMHVGAFHYCFRSKDELVLEVMRTLDARGVAAVEAVAARTTGPGPGELIWLAVDAYWDHLHSHPRELLLGLELVAWALRRPREHAAQEQYAAAAAHLERWLHRLAATGSLTWRTPVPELARALLAAVRGLTLEWLVTRDAAAARLQLDRLAEQVRAEAGLSVADPR